MDNNNMSQKRQITPDEWQKKLDSFSIPKQHMNELVMNYLVLEGYKDAAEGFQSEAGIEGGVELSALEDRKQVRSFIMEGSIEEAINLLNRIDPEILDNNSDLLFKLHLQKLIEYIRCNQVNEALAYGQEIIAVSEANRNPALLEELEKVMSLLAFDDISKSPVSEVASLSYRQKLASQVNAAILDVQGLNVHSKLQTYMKLLFWSQRKLETVMDFPKIKDI